jgi:alpha-ketoglutarate-dependent taurine dioxygenase
MTNAAAARDAAWTGATIDAASNWYVPLPGPVADAITRAIGGRMLLSLTDLRLSETDRTAGAAELRVALDPLENGRGFVIFEMPPRFRSREEQVAAYWLLGQMLGEPVTQNVQGTLLYDVRDTGQDVRYGARFSVTNADSSFHTDNSFGDDVVDYVGLLCLQASRSGGQSQLVHGHAALAELQRRDPGALEVLTRSFHVDRRGGLRPGEGPTAHFPVVARDGGLVCRYLRFWIEAGHEKAGEPLTREQLQALDALDTVLSDPKLRVEFQLKPGDMFFINNRWLFHSRTAFEDYPEPERRRHYVRLWLRQYNSNGSRNERAT